MKSFSTIFFSNSKYHLGGLALLKNHGAHPLKMLTLSLNNLGPVTTTWLASSVSEKDVDEGSVKNACSWKELYSFRFTAP